MDHDMPFGIASAHYCLGAVVEATIDIITASQKELAWDLAHPSPTDRRHSCDLFWVNGEALTPTSDVVDWRALGVGPILKWADDLIPFRFPVANGDFQSGNYHYLYSMETIRSITLPLGVPWHAKKWSDFASTVIYLGFIWDLRNRTVSLQNDKRLKYLSKVSTFIDLLKSNARVDKKSVQSVNGTLAHICFVHPSGRAYLPGLSAFAASFESEHKPRWAPRSLLSDMEFWMSFLLHPAIPRTLISRGSAVDLDIWCDASTSWGIGLYFGDQWDAWKLKDGWKRDGRDIGWAEAIAVELVARHLDAMGISNANVIIHSDNNGVIGAFSKGRGRNFQINHAIRRVESLGLSTNVSYILLYTTSELNRADPISRGDLGHAAKQIPFYILLPEELSPLLVHV